MVNENPSAKVEQIENDVFADSGDEGDLADEDNRVISLSFSNLGSGM